VTEGLSGAERLCMIRHRWLSRASVRANPTLLEVYETLCRSRNPNRRRLHCSRRDRIVATLQRHRPKHCWHAMEILPGSGLYLPHLLKLAESVVALDWGLGLERSLEGWLRNGKLEQLLWTQYCVAKVAE
jgi:hypothetical protein